MLIYKKDSFSLDDYYCFQDGDDYMLGLRRQWEENLKAAFEKLPVLNKKDSIHLTAKL